MDIAKKLAQELGITYAQAEKTIALIDDGNTIPFIARYRKEATGGLSDDVLRKLDERLTYMRSLEERKGEVLRLIDEQGKLTDEIKAEIDKAEVLQRVEDLYKPYRQKKTTRAGKAREKGLEPLAMLISLQQQRSGSVEETAMPYVDPDKGVNSVEEAVQGALDIVAEMIADDADTVQEVRNLIYDTGLIVTEAADRDEKTAYDMYYGKQEAVSKIPNHRVLAVNRGEKEG